MPSGQFLMARMVRPSSCERVTMPCTPNSLTMRPSITNSTLKTEPPQAVVPARHMFSTHLLVTVSIRPRLPFSSMKIIGLALWPPMVNVTIWISGNARPMPSTSTMGRPRRAAAAIGSMEFTPPASIGMTAVAFFP